MSIKKLSRVAVATSLITLGLASTAAAASKWCFTLPTGQEICIPVLVEELRIKLPPDPGPYRIFEIDELTQGLTEVLGVNRQNWILRDALGQRAIMMDLATGQAYEIPQQPAAGL